MNREGKLPKLDREYNYHNRMIERQLEKLNALNIEVNNVKEELNSANNQLNITKGELLLLEENRN
ncbi:hypothetical protein [Candidatus Enterovibrio escicola]|nr:hypothetical protein [Candidatus Enterovibrio escacola]